ncbi:MAG: transposase, partial [bacterium]
MENTMSHLRRTYDGPTKIYFVTSNTYQRVPLFRINENARSVIKNIKFLEKRKDIIIIAYVIMPDHIHLLFEIISNMNVSQVMHSI